MSGFYIEIILLLLLFSLYRFACIITDMASKIFGTNPLLLYGTISHPLPHIGVLLELTTSENKLSKMARNLAMYVVIHARVGSVNEVL